MSAKQTSQFFYEEIDLTPYFLENFENEINQISIKNRNISFSSINYKETTIYFCEHMENIKLASCLSFNILFKENKKQIEVKVNEYEGDLSDIKCYDREIKEEVQKIIENYKKKLLKIYKNKDERSSLFNFSKQKKKNIEKEIKNEEKKTSEKLLKFKNVSPSIFDILFKPEFINLYEKIREVNDKEIVLEKFNLIFEENIKKILDEKRQQFKFKIKENQNVFYIEVRNGEFLEFKFKGSDSDEDLLMMWIIKGTQFFKQPVELIN